MPPLGDGLGGMQWEEVKPKPTAVLDAMSEIHWVIYSFTKQQPVPHSNRQTRFPAGAGQGTPIAFLAHVHAD